MNLLSWAINESVCLYGLLLGITSRNLVPFLPFLVTALVLNVVMFPRIGVLAEMAREVLISARP